MRLMKLIPDHTNINFVGARFYAFGIDGLLVLISLVSLWIHGLNLGIDFTGGVLVEVKSQQSINIGQMRGQVDRLGFAEAQLQYVGGGECEMPANSCVLIRIQPQPNTPDQAVRQRIAESHVLEPPGDLGERVEIPLLGPPDQPLQVHLASPSPIGARDQ